MLELLNHLHATGNAMAMPQLLGSLKSSDHMAIFSANPKFYAILVKRFHLKPLPMLSSIVQHIAPIEQDTHVIKQPRLYSVSHLYMLIAEFLHLEPPYPALTYDLLIVTPMDFYYPRKGYNLLINGAHYYSIEEHSIHAQYLCFKVLEAMYKAGTNGTFSVQQFASMQPKPLSGFRETIQYCQKSIYSNYTFYLQKYINSIAPNFTQLCHSICSWSFYPVHSAVCDPLYMALLGIKGSQMGELAAATLSTSEFLVRALIVLLEMRCILSVYAWRVMLALLGRYRLQDLKDITWSSSARQKVSAAQRNSETSRLWVANMLDYKGHLFELCKICLPGSGEWRIYLQKLEEQLYYL